MYKISDYKILATSQRIPRETVDYGVKMLGVTYEWHETMGENIRVGVIDTGIDLDHEDLRGRIKEYINFTSKYQNDVEDTNGHGTHVAGSICANRNGIGIVGAAPKCDLYIAKAFGTGGHAETESIIKSFEWLIAKQVNVINMSFSASEPNEYEQIMVKKCYENGIVLVGAAGNDGGIGDEDTIGYPAKYDNVIAVTAVDMNLNRAPFSSQGSRAQIAAAGTNILSTYKNNTYAVLSGTSMATPLITGAVAILQGKAKIRFGRCLTPDEISLVMNIYADDLGYFGKDNQLGYGLFSFGRFFM